MPRLRVFACNVFFPLYEVWGVLGPGSTPGDGGLAQVVGCWTGNLATQVQLAWLCCSYTHSFDHRQNSQIQVVCAEMSEKNLERHV